VEELRVMVGKASLKNTKPISHHLQSKMRGVPINHVQIEFKKGAAWLHRKILKNKTKMTNTNCAKE
jgi:hypothetical protein